MKSDVIMCTVFCNAAMCHEGSIDCVIKVVILYDIQGPRKSRKITQDVLDEPWICALSYNRNSLVHFER